MRLTTSMSFVLWGVLGLFQFAAASQGTCETFDCPENFVPNIANSGKFPATLETCCQAEMCDTSKNVAVGMEVSNNGQDPEKNAIDGDLSTYWDQRDNKGLYILKMKGERRFHGYTIIGYSKDFAPKSWELRCDQVVIDSQEDHKYDNKPGPAKFYKCLAKVASCTELNLVLKSWYGNSPTIREFKLHTTQVICSNYACPDNYVVKNGAAPIVNMAKELADQFCCKATCAAQEDKCVAPLIMSHNPAETENCCQAHTSYVVTTSQEYLDHLGDQANTWAKPVGALCTALGTIVGCIGGLWKLFKWLRTSEDDDEEEETEQLSRE